MITEIAKELKAAKARIVVLEKQLNLAAQAIGEIHDVADKQVGEIIKDYFKKVK